MTRITNHTTLTSHGHQSGRETVLAILEAGMQASDPYHNVFRAIHRDGDRLLLGNPDFEPPGAPRGGDEVIDLASVGRIFVVGAGKGIQRTAKALEEILGKRLTGGHVIDKQGTPLILDKIEVTLGAHPVPDEACVVGCRRILELAQELRPDDLVFTAVGNGVSSLLTLPVDEVSLDDIRRMTYTFQIARGGPTIDLIPIRNHLDQLKGGKISRHLQPARAIHLLAFLRPSYHELMVGDIYQWLHTLPDITTFADAVASLKRWDIWDECAPAIRDFLLQADPAHESLKVDEFEAMASRIFCLLPEHLGMVPTAQAKARELGFDARVLYNTFHMLAEASQVGRVVANLAAHSELDGEPFTPPCVLVSGGELLVTVGQARGMGGRNQEYALSAALELANTHHVIMGSVDSDGTDGPGHQFAESPAEIPVLTGGLVDFSTTARAADLGLDLRAELKRHNASPPLYQLGDGIVATPGVSMGDLSVTLIMDRSQAQES